MKVALAQIAPVLLDREATLDKVVDAVEEAASQGAELVAFGETLVPGYPLWLCRTGGAAFEDPDQKRIFARYSREAVVLSAGHLDPVIGAAGRGGLTVVLGVAERDPVRGHSLFASAVVLDGGGIRWVHRKLKPTHEERLVWADGDGQGLQVHSVGDFRLGVLNCWESWMPLARAALQGQGEDLHVSLWPGSQGLTGEITRYMAREGRSYVLSASSLLRPEDIPDTVPLREGILADEGELLYDGGSCIAGPEGDWVLEPVVGQEGVFCADLDLDVVRQARQSFDPAGHYGRPDVLRLEIERSRHGRT